MGLIALPAMLKRNYDKKIALGCIPAGGALGALIPPSLAFILYGIQAEVSIGKLYAGGILPGLLLSLLFSIYIGIRCYLKPELGPALHEGIATWEEKFTSLKAVILPLLIVVAVLGSIFTGVATVTESASIGALGTIISGAIYRKLNWQMVKETCYTTLKLTSMVTFILIGASVFTSVYTTIRGEEVVQDLIMKIAIGRWGVILIIQFIFFILGCLLDPASIILICTPIFVPLITKLGFDPLWFGVLFVVNMEMGYLTPPFGMALFILKGVVPKEITTLDIYRSIVPFVGLQALGLVIIMIFPQVALVLPRLIFK
jgi:tripartite ATP-independent transporter DctM subunit